MAVAWHKKPFDKMTLLQRMHYNRAASLAFAPTQEVRDKIAAKYAADPLPPLRPQRDKTLRRPLDQREVVPSEHQEQSAVVTWWNAACLGYELPRIALFAIPNGGARDAITGARLKAEGVRRGVFDLCLAAARRNFHGLYIEMKKIDGAKPTDEQVEFRTYLLGAGYHAVVHYGANDAIKEIEAYLKP